MNWYTNCRKIIVKEKNLKYYKSKRVNRKSTFEGQENNKAGDLYDIGTEEEFVEDLHRRASALRILYKSK